MFIDDMAEYPDEIALYTNSMTGRDNSVLVAISTFNSSVVKMNFSLDRVYVYGEGTLPKENSIINISNKNVHVTAIKQAEDGNGTIVRYYNPTDDEQKVSVRTMGKLYRCNMDETVIEEMPCNHIAEKKKIITIRIVK